MHRSHSYGWSSLVAALALLTAQPAARAQSVDSAASDSVRTKSAPADRLAGRARIALDASATRVDGARFTVFDISGAAAPFFGEHLQIGIAPTGTLSRAPGAPTVSEGGTSLLANYVFGGDAHWRGYIGGFGSAAASNSWTSTQIGAQAGVLYFLTPALAVRGEVRRREILTPAIDRAGVWNVFVTLDPYAFGAASREPITGAGLGTVDLTATYFFDWFRGRFREGQLVGTVAPYLTRWAQVGVSGEAFGWSSGPHLHQARGFGRLYLPLTVRTQPFAEGYAETSTLSGQHGGLTSYGGEVGVRRVLNANVALDVGVERNLHPSETFGSGSFTQRYRYPGSTVLAVGLMTRIGRAR